MLGRLLLSRSVYRGERGPVACAAGAICLLEIADAFATNCADALYLSRRGVGGLGIQLAVSSALLAVTLGFIGALADRGGRAQLLGRLAVIGAAVLLLARFALWLAPVVTPAGLLVVTKQLSAALDLGFWILIADRFDARQSRRLIPVFATAGGVGLVMGSFATRGLLARIGVEDLLLLGSVACLGAALLVCRLAFAGAGGGGLHLLGPRLGLIESYRDGARATRRSELAGLLAIIVGIAGAVGPILYTALAAQAAAAFPTEAELAGFYGRLRGLTNLATLFAQAALAPVLLRVVGVAAAFLIAPVVAALAGTALALSGSLTAAATAQAVSRVTDAAIETPAEKLAQNLLPHDLRGRIGAFLDGVAKRSGALLGGLATSVIAGSSRLGGLLVAAAFAWTAAALLLRRRFPRLVVDGLVARREPADAAVFDDGTVRHLALELSGLDDARRELAIEVALRAPPERAVTLLVGAARSRPEARGRLIAALDQLLDGEVPPSPALGAQLVELLAQAQAPLERAILVQAIGRTADPSARKVLAALQTDAEAPAVRLAIACALRNHPPDELLIEALALSEKAKQDAAVSLLLGQPSDTALRTVAAEELRVELVHMASSREPLRGGIIDAAVRLAEVGSESERRLVFDALATAARRGAVADWRDPIAMAARTALEDLRLPPSVRAAALRALAMLGEVESAPFFVRQLADRDDAVRAAAAAGLGLLGVGAVPVLAVAARFGSRAARDEALALLRGVQMLPAACDDLVAAELEALEDTAQRRTVLASLGATLVGGLFLERLDERRAEISRTLLLVLELRLADRDVGRAARGLSYARARALEALDALLPRVLAARVLSALEGTPRDDVQPLSFDDAVRAELGGGDPLAQLLLIHALGSAERTRARTAIRAMAASATMRVDPLRLLAKVHVHAEESDVPRSVETMLFLREIPMFSELSPSHLAELASVASWETAAPGDRLEPDGLVVVASGRVDGHGVGAVLGEGLLFGETAPSPLIANEKSRVLRLARDDFERAVGDLPAIALAICRALRRRAG